MLPKKNRLNIKEYKEVFSAGKTVHTPLLMIKVEKNTENKRFSVVVPKKVLKKAYQRNALRRYVYNVIREKIDIINNVSVIFILKKEFNNSNEEGLKKEIEEQLKKLD